MLKVDRKKKCIPGVRRHPEWTEFQVRWRWLMDSFEGADRYRQASYGTDSRGLPVRNLIRHKREYPDPSDQSISRGSNYGGIPIGSDPTVSATDDDYELRRARTPVPTFVSEAVLRDVSKIFARKPSRTVPDLGYDDLNEWLENVDGRGTCLSDWIEQIVAPIFLTLGQIDLLFDHPAVPEGANVVSRADEDELGLRRCVASYILPENVVWWQLDCSGQYLEVDVREHAESEDDEHECVIRNWTTDSWQLFDESGDAIGPRVPHSFGRVPIVRVFDRRKARSCNVGQSRYEATAERQREYYNRDSELILSDTTQAHPLLQGPEDFIQADGSIPIGPSWLLPKKKNTQGGTATYEGFEVVDFPKGGADSIRLNKAEIRDDVDRDCGLTKPAGASGTGRSTVAQSGLSKVMDSIDGNDRLGTISRALAEVERQALRYVMVVLRDDPNAMELAEEIEVSYPAVFALSGMDELSKGLQDFQLALADSGSCPDLEITVFCEWARKLLPGYPDELFETIEEEIRLAVQSNATRKAQAAESLPLTPTNTTPTNPTDPTTSDVVPMEDGQPDPAETTTMDE